jgi:prepilin-type N-terminal cleavage/methylation domain-containing protein
MPAEPPHNPASTLRLGRSEDGFTLIELLVVILLLSVVAGALMGPLTLSQRITNRASNYASAQREARTGLDSMVSQIRQAWVVLGADPNAVEMNVNLNGVATHVLYQCDVPQPGSALYRECLRVQAPAGAALPSLSAGTVVLRNLTNGTTADPVFSFTPDPISPYYMSATIKVPASNAMNGGQNHSIVFSDGALMRNQNVGN